MKKNLLATALLLTAAQASADYLELTFPQGKTNNCTVTAKYWDGDKNRYTCTETFTGSFSSKRTVRQDCEGSERVNHLNDGGSRVDIQSSGSCAASYVINLVGTVKAKKTRGKDKQKDGSFFYNSVGSSNDNKFYEQVRSRSGGYKKAFGSYDLREVSNNTTLKFFLNKRYDICRVMKLDTCWHEDKANYTQLSGR
ncbi:MAG: hypothetical protein GY951_16705 [Psychromonas sp.]|nr:hypothetical protein [Alteromonadales bacterium]MCP5079681.1 hypothetical protein [Psychromonas sp.]